jgi:hypothetical protein
MCIYVLRIGRRKQKERITETKEGRKEGRRKQKERITGRKEGRRKQKERQSK